MSPTLRLSLSNGIHEVSTPSDLRSLMEAASQRQFDEIHFKGHDERSLLLLKSGERGLLVFCRYVGDPGLTSRAADEFEADLNEREFVLNNGQRDCYPVDWTVSFGLASLALEHYFDTGDMLPEIRWHDDS